MDRYSHRTKETKKNSEGTIQCKRDQSSRFMLQSNNNTSVITDNLFLGYRSNC